MAQQDITPTENGADSLTKIEANFTELYICANIHAATAKTTPVDADEIGLIDSAASNVLKKLTWANFKSTLLTYFQGIIPSLNRDWTGWQEGNETWTYSNVDDPTGVITISGDKTGKYSAGMRIKFTNGGNTIYGIISKDPTYSSPNTTITFLHQIDPTDSLALVLMANSAITAPYYSTQKAPLGFPLNPAKWSVETQITSSLTQTSPTTNTWYNLGSTNIVVPIGEWKLYYAVEGNANRATTGFIDVEFALSTSNSSVSDYALKSRALMAIEVATNNYILALLSKCKDITIASKTTYYAIWRTSLGALAVSSDGDTTGQLGIIRATCAYL